jgi:protein gp37
MRGATVADGSHIEWTEATWNPLVGCTKVSAGCDNCYAETLVNRFAGHNSAFPNRFDIVTMRGEKMLTQPLRWRRPRRIFVNSLSDLFHKDVPDEFIGEVFAVMALAPQHTFQLLTKRHARMRALLSDRGWVQDYVASAVTQRVVKQGLDDYHLAESWPDWWPLSNVWLGVSVEDQHWADIRIPALLDTPAAVRWVSAEPLLGPVCLDAFHSADGHGRSANLPCEVWPQGIDWIVVGGESGPGARPMHPQWARDLRDQCAAAEVPFLFKQWGQWVTEDQSPQDIVLPSTSYRMLGDDGPAFWRVGKNAAGRELDARLHDGYPPVENRPQSRAVSGA